jgi:hypothetical protein
MTEVIAANAHRRNHISASADGDPYREFRALDELRLLLREIREQHSKSLAYFRRPGGFIHFKAQLKGKKGPDISRASTSVAVVSLTSAGLWAPDDTATTSVIEELLIKQPWDRPGLGKGWNVFTVGFILEAVDALLAESTAGKPPKKWLNKIERAERFLAEELASGSASIENYPPSAYMTQLAVRVLRKRKSARLDDLRTEISDWAWGEVAKQLALVLSRSKLADVFELAYSIIICASLEQVARMNPDRALLLTSSLMHFFQAQLEDGTWPRGRPRFPDLTVGGSGFSYDYELLVQLLQEKELQPFLKAYLPQLDLAARALWRARLPLDNGGLGWSSGNYLKEPAAESWATASAYHFVHALDRLLAKQIREVVFSYLGARLSDEKPWRPGKLCKAFASKNFIDCPLWNADKNRYVSLRSTVCEAFVLPLYEADRDLYLRGTPLPRKIPMSAILYGPPGTSKTQLATYIADFLEWPLLAIDPSHLLRFGSDQMQAEADRVFRMLAALERVVVFLDEFDEMGRERQSATEMTSRLLTTLMLPKFTSINENRRIAFIVATNYIDRFDLAIRRPGRFDVIVQVLPPKTSAKIQSTEPDVRALLNEVAQHREYAKMIGTLTFSEFKSFVEKIDGHGVAEIEKMLEEAHRRCTLATPYVRTEDVSDGTTWGDIALAQKERVRLPNLS